MQETIVGRLERLEQHAVLSYVAFTGHVEGCPDCPDNMDFQTMCGIGKARFITWSQAEARDADFRKRLNRMDPEGQLGEGLAPSAV